MTPLAQALAVASKHWASRRPGSKPSTMATFAGVCVGVLGDTANAEALTSRDAVNLLSALRVNRSASTVGTYYRAFRTMLKLNGVQTYDWPTAPTPPRQPREAIPSAGAEDCIRWLDENGYSLSGALAHVLVATGLRVQSEALDKAGAISLERGGPYLVARVRGKGGHVRTLPVVQEPGASILQDGERMDAIRAVPYRSHLKAWAKAVEAVGVKSRLATPHALRHLYACEAYRKSGGNLKMVQELLGHSDPKTTARYLHVSLDDAATALSRD